MQSHYFLSGKTCWKDELWLLPIIESLQRYLLNKGSCSEMARCIQLIHWRKILLGFLVYCFEVYKKIRKWYLRFWVCENTLVCHHQFLTGLLRFFLLPTAVCHLVRLHNTRESCNIVELHSCLACGNASSTTSQNKITDHSTGKKQQPERNEISPFDHQWKFFSAEAVISVSLSQACAVW